MQYSKCVTCNTTFKAKRSGQKYCSLVCRNKSYRNKMGIVKGGGHGRRGYIYIIQSGDSNYYKIGQTVSRPMTRLHELQCGSPEELKMYELFTVSNMGKIENQTHKLIEGKRIRGEWFELTQDNLDQITVFLSQVS